MSVTVVDRTTHDEYVDRCLSDGRPALLRLLHAGGIKQGARRLSDRELAELLWRAFGRRAARRRLAGGR